MKESPPREIPAGAVHCNTRNGPQMVPVVLNQMAGPQDPKEPFSPRAKSHMVCPRAKGKTLGPLSGATPNQELTLGVYKMPQLGNWAPTPPFVPMEPKIKRPLLGIPRVPWNPKKGPNWEENLKDSRFPPAPWEAVEFLSLEPTKEKCFVKRELKFVPPRGSNRLGSFWTPLEKALPKSLGIPMVQGIFGKKRKIALP